MQALCMSTSCVSFIGLWILPLRPSYVPVCQHLVYIHSVVCGLQLLGSRVLRTHIEQDEASCSELYMSNEEVFWLQLRVLASAHHAVGHGNFKKTMLTQQQNSSKENWYEFGRRWPDNVKTE